MFSRLNCQIYDTTNKNECCNQQSYFPSASTENELLVFYAARSLFNFNFKIYFISINGSPNLT